MDNDLGFPSAAACKRNILLGTVCFYLAGLPLSAQAVNRLSDSVFLPNAAPVMGPCMASTGLCQKFYEPHGTATYTVAIDRVVGPGILNVDVDPNGKLLHPTTLKANGVVAPTVTLKIEADATTIVTCGAFVGSPCLSPKVGHHVMINGHDAGDYTTYCDLSSPHVCPFPRKVSLTVEVPIENINFGIRNLAGNPTPGLNTVIIKSDPSKLAGDCECNDGRPGVSIKVTATYPTVLVHGYRSGPWSWGPSPSTNATGGCGTAPNPGLGYNGGFNFVSALAAAGMPYVCTLGVFPLSDVSDGGAQVRDNITKAAQRFGVKHVHLIGHSKGGWWIRAALPLLQDINLGVYSVTTIDTPHHGSILADKVVEARERKLVALQNPLLVAGLLSDYSPSAEDDLQTSVAEKNNAKLGNPTNITFTVDGVQNKAQYFSTAADADLNGNGVIDPAPPLPDEGFPYLISYTSPAINNSIINEIYKTVASQISPFVTSTVIINGHRIVQVPSVTLPGPKPNDLAVTVLSAQYDGFTPLIPAAPYGSYVGIPYFLGNHATIKCGGPTIPGCSSGNASMGAAMRVLLAILSTQPIN